MKKILLLATILVALCSCGPANVQERTNDQVMRDFDRIRHFTYKGHKYISFENVPNTNGATIGIVHDPNCECNK